MKTVKKILIYIICAGLVLCSLSVGVPIGFENGEYSFSGKENFSLSGKSLTGVLYIKDDKTAVYFENGVRVFRAKAGDNRETPDKMPRKIPGRARKQHSEKTAADF